MIEPNSRREEAMEIPEQVAPEPNKDDCSDSPAQYWNYGQLFLALALSFIAQVACTMSDPWGLTI